MNQILTDDLTEIMKELKYRRVRNNEQNRNFIFLNLFCLSTTNRHIHTDGAH